MPGTKRPFDSFVDRSGGPDACWPWQGGRDQDGYGLYGGDPAIGRKTQRANRVAYVQANGPITKGMFVCHECDNPPCCNPAHLYAGSPLQNVHDAIERGRWQPSQSTNRVPKAGSLNGQSKLTEADIPVIRRRLVAGEVVRAIALDYGVSYAAIWLIQRGTSWRHVAA